MDSRIDIGPGEYIVFYPDRMQPYTAWRRGKVIGFFADELEARAAIARDRKVKV